MKPPGPVKCNITQWGLAKECKVSLNLKYLFRKFNLLTKMKSHTIISRKEKRVEKYLIPRGEKNEELL